MRRNKDKGSRVLGEAHLEQVGVVAVRVAQSGVVQEFTSLAGSWRSLGSRALWIGSLES